MPSNRRRVLSVAEIPNVITLVKGVIIMICYVM